MPAHDWIQSALGQEDPILRRTAKSLGIDWMGVQGTLSGRELRLLFRVTVPSRWPLSVRFPLRVRLDSPGLSG